MDRHILHIYQDSFFVEVARQHNSVLKGKPMLICGMSWPKHTDYGAKFFALMVQFFLLKRRYYYLHGRKQKQRERRNN